MIFSQKTPRPNKLYLNLIIDLCMVITGNVKKGDLCLIPCMMHPTAAISKNTWDAWHNLGSSEFYGCTGFSTDGTKVMLNLSAVLVVV